MNYLTSFCAIIFLCIAAKADDINYGYLCNSKYECVKCVNDYCGWPLFSYLAYCEANCKAPTNVVTPTAPATSLYRCNSNTARCEQCTPVTCGTDMVGHLWNSLQECGTQCPPMPGAPGTGNRKFVKTLLDV